MSWIYNNESDQIIIDEASDEGGRASPTQADDNASPEEAETEEMVLPIISSVYSENPTDQNTINGGEEPESGNVAANVSQQDNDSNMSDSDIELVSVDYTNDTLSDSSEDNRVQTVKKKKRRKGRGQMLPNPCVSKHCRNGCNLVSEAERRVLFEEFSMLDNDARKAYIQKWVNVVMPEHSLMDGMRPAREYYVMTQNQTPTRVCAQFFSATLGISLPVVSKYVKEKINNVTKSLEVGEESIDLGTNNVSVRIDVMEMIKEIQKREEIWNQDMPDRETIDVERAWDEVCNSLVPNYSRQLPGQQVYIKKRLIAKWCGLRSSYFNYFTKKRLLDTLNPSAKTPYMAYSHLLTFLDKTSSFTRHASNDTFLEKTSNFTPNASNDDCSSEKPDGYATVFIMENQLVEAESSEPTEAETLKRMSSSFAIDEDRLTKKPKLGEQNNPYGVLSLPYTVEEDQPSPEAPIVNSEREELRSAPPKSNVEVTNTSSSGVVDSEESDLIFFKSLLPIIKTLDHHQKLQFRLGVITNLQKLTAGEPRQDEIVSSSPRSQLNRIQQSQVSQTAPQNPAVTSTSLSANRVTTENFSEDSNAMRTRSPNFSVLISSSSDDSDC